MKSAPDRFYYCSDDHIIPHISLRRQRIVGGWASFKHEIKSFNGKQFDFYRVHYAVGEIAIPTQVKHKTRKVRDMKWKNHRHRQIVVQPTNTKSTVYGFTVDSESHW